MQISNHAHVRDLSTYDLVYTCEIFCILSTSFQKQIAGSSPFISSLIPCPQSSYAHGWVENGMIACCGSSAIYSRAGAHATRVYKYFACEFLIFVTVSLRCIENKNFGG